MIRISSCAVPVSDERPLAALAAERLGVSPNDILAVEIVRKALDARRYRGAPLAFVYTLDVCVNGSEKRLLARLRRDSHVALAEKEEKLDLSRFSPLAPGELRPVVVGPVSYLLMAKPSDEAPEGFHPLDRLSDVLHAYGHLLMDLHQAGATWVQLDEPALVSDSWNVERQRVLDAVRDAYTWLGATVERPQILVAGTYGSLGDALPVLGQAPIEAVGLDLVAGALPEAGDLAAIGTAETIHAANRGENIVIVFVNNAIYGMTGGQMAPTTLIGMPTATCPYGRDVALNGYPLKIGNLLAQLDGTCLVTRQSVQTPAAARKTKKMLRLAFENSMAGKGTSVVEVVSTCSSGWKKSPTASNRWMMENMFPFYPLGDLKNV